jgi:hypothetical protein
MAIENVSGTSESVSNQEQISVTREDDGLLSNSIFADASATASADGESFQMPPLGPNRLKAMWTAPTPLSPMMKR